MIENEKIKKRIPKYDRVTLNEESLKRVDVWLKQARDSKAGIVIHRNDIVNWFIFKSPELLPISMVNDLGSNFFDEERFLRLTLRRIQDAKSKGENISLDALLTEKHSVKTKKERKPRKRKDDTNTIDLEQINKKKIS